MDITVFEDEERIGLSLDQINNLCNNTKNKDPAENPLNTANNKAQRVSTDESTGLNSDVDPTNDIDLDILHFHQNVITLMDYIEDLCNGESDIFIKDLVTALSDVLFLGLKTGLVEECENFSGEQKWSKPLTNYSLDINCCRENMPDIEDHLESCLCCQLLEALIQVRLVRITWSWKVSEVYWELVVLQEELLKNESEELNKLLAN